MLVTLYLSNGQEKEKKKQAKDLYLNTLSHTSP
jgi:hypothetical protein